MYAETKFNIQHFEIFFLPYFPQVTKTCFFGGGNINLSSPAELVQRVKKVKVHEVILKYTCEIYK